jgi:hypothetical protein
MKKLTLGPVGRLLAADYFLGRLGAPPAKEWPAYGHDAAAGASRR